MMRRRIQPSRVEAWEKQYDLRAIQRSAKNKLAAELRAPLLAMHIADQELKEELRRKEEKWRAALAE